MSLQTLVETCRYNLHASLIAQYWVGNCTTLKKLKQQGEQAENILTMVLPVSRESWPKPERLAKFPKEKSFQTV